MRGNPSGAPSRLVICSIALRIPAFPKGMNPNVYGWVWNVLLKVYSSLNMHRLIRERFHKGGGPVSLDPPTEPPTPDEHRAEEGYLWPSLFHSILSCVSLPLHNDNLVISNALVARLDWQGGGLEKAQAWDSIPSLRSFLGIRRAIWVSRMGPGT